MCVAWHKFRGDIFTIIGNVFANSVLRSDHSFCAELLASIPCIWAYAWVKKQRILQWFSGSSKSFLELIRFCNCRQYGILWRYCCTRARSEIYGHLNGYFSTRRRRRHQQWLLIDAPSKNGPHNHDRLSYSHHSRQTISNFSSSCWNRAMHDRRNRSTKTQNLMLDLIFRFKRSFRNCNYENCENY